MVHSHWPTPRQETYNRDTEPNGNLYWYLSLCSMNISRPHNSTQVLFYLFQYRSRCRPVRTHYITRMDSSRMCTARSLTVSLYLIVSHAHPPRATTHAPRSNHACPPGATMHAPPEQPCMPLRATTHAPPEQPCTPPWSNHACPPEQPHIPPQSNHAHPPGATTHAPHPPRSNHTHPPC